MSRSGYTDEIDDILAHGRWRAAVNSAIRGKRGQAALREIRAALDAMPEKALIGESLVSADGEFCTLGVLGSARGLDMSSIDPDDYDAVAALFNLAPAMVREIAHENDEIIRTFDLVVVDICDPLYRGEPRSKLACVDIDPDVVAANRWRHMRDWVEKAINKDTP